jgi:glycosyltransferase involved in cell wall biosynthesis
MCCGTGDGGITPTAAAGRCAGGGVARRQCAHPGSAYFHGPHLVRTGQVGRVINALPHFTSSRLNEWTDALALNRHGVCAHPQASPGHLGSPFQGFWMGGFEGADHVNASGVALDMALVSGHLQRLDEDHRRCAQMGLRTVRESIGWRLAESGQGRIDLSRAQHIAASAHRHGLQVLWTLMHYGLPPDLSLHDDAMIERFVCFAAEVARVIGRASRLAPVFTPINEINFLAWAASQPGVFSPPNNGPLGEDNSSSVSGYDVKRRLARAALAAMAAMRAVEPRSRFLHVEPVVHVVAPTTHPEWATQADQICSWQWQAWDLLCGRMEPELGGHPGALDLLGINHYHSSQWEVGTEARLHWHLRDPRRRPVVALLEDVWQRYRRPVLVAETSHVGAGRAAWLHEVAAEVRMAQQRGIPVQGLCLYPLVDRPDWNNTSQWHRSGLWHVSAATTPPNTQHLTRWREPELATALNSWQKAQQAALRPHNRKPLLLAFSHLRWEGLRHRTHHLLTCLSAHWQVKVVEEPRWTASAPRLECISHGPCIDVLVPHTPLPHEGFHATQQNLLQSLLKAHLHKHGETPALLWLSTPMAWPLAQSLQAGGCVYDCGDELSGFINAPSQMAALESSLLQTADFVFTASTSLARSRQHLAGARLHVLPNAVDCKHFVPPRATTTDWATEEAARFTAHLPAGPRLGYAGAVDDRLDLALLNDLSRARPDAQFVMVGPFLKMQDSALPRAPNLHWLGPAPYAIVPALMGQWQAALLPFLVQRSTENALPLKALEYLATGLPVVSTGLHELVQLKNLGVVVTSQASDFLAACDDAVQGAVSNALRRQRAWHARRVLPSWKNAAAHAQALLLTLDKTPTPLRPTPHPSKAI